jgi:hypothetical protein
VAVASSTSTPFDSDTSGPITHHVTGALSRPEIASVTVCACAWCVCCVCVRACVCACMCVCVGSER